MLKRNKKGEGNHITPYGYRQLVNNKFEHVLVAEKALGKPLPPEAVVHHVNEDRLDNRPENLVICPDRAYHNMIHRRMRALAACGDANWRKCCICKEYDSPDNLYIHPSNFSARHKSCHNDQEAIRRASL